MKFREAIFAILICLLVGSSCQCDKENREKRLLADRYEFGEGKDTFALLFTTSVLGWVTPCGCTSQPLGGIARLASAVQNANDHFSLGTLFIDGGDLLFEKLSINPADSCQETARVDLLLGSYRDLSCLGTFPRPFDSAMGVEFRDRKLASFKLPDLTMKAREGFIAGSNNFKLGILFLDEKNSVELDIKAKTLKKNGADAVIAISHLPRIQTRAAAEKAPTLDLIILAAVMDETPTSAQVIGDHGPFIVSAAKQGQFLGLVEFHKSQESSNKWQIDNRKQLKEARWALLVQRKRTLSKQIEQAQNDTQIEFFKARIQEIDDEYAALQGQKNETILSGNFIATKSIALSRKILGSPVFEARLQNYEKQIPSLVAQCEVNLKCPSLGPNQAKFVGAETCKNCHSAAYDFWKKAVYEVPATDEKGNAITALSGHAKAWKTLEEKVKTEDRSCVGCHSVGFMQPGGYCKVKEVDKFKNVQCESCHGAGSLHAATGNKGLIKREVSESVCRGCHHVPHIATTESFVYNEKVQKILGKGHGALFLAKIKHETSSSLVKDGP